LEAGLRRLAVLAWRVRLDSQAAEANGQKQRGRVKPREAPPVSN
jgi:hypothetical protein